MKFSQTGEMGVKTTVGDGKSRKREKKGKAKKEEGKWTEVL